MVEVRAYETADVAAMVDVWNEVVRDGIAFPQEDELDETTGSAGVGASVQQGFSCDNGRNIHAGDHLIVNYGCTILDVAEVTMGDWVMIGPHVLISTVNHPLSPRGRRNRLGVAKPVRIGDDVWIGGHATILPGVTIGDGAVVAAGLGEVHPILLDYLCDSRLDRILVGLSEELTIQIKDIISVGDTTTERILREAPRIGGGPRRAADLRYSALRVGQYSFGKLNQIDANDGQAKPRSRKVSPLPCQASSSVLPG